MFGISPKNGVKKHFFRPEKWHGFSPAFYSVHDTMVRFAPANENQGTQSILGDGKSQTRNGAHISTPEREVYTFKNTFFMDGRRAHPRKTCFERIDSPFRPHRLLTSRWPFLCG